MLSPMHLSPFAQHVRSRVSYGRNRRVLAGVGALVLGVVAVAVAGPAQAATTPNLDTSFGAAGVVTVAGEPDATVVDSWGRTLLVTEDGSGVARLTRLNVSGAKDTAFGTGGAVTLPYAGKLTLNDDGSASVVAPGPAQQGIRVHRVSSTGTTLASTNLLPARAVELVWSLASRDDGDLIVHGIDQDTSPATHLLAAVKPDGTLDSAWGTAGVLALQNDVYAVAATGNSVLALTAGGVRRYNAAGGVDPSFTVTPLPTGFDPHSISVSGGAYYLSGTSARKMALVKVLTTGALDTTFGSGGMATGTARDCTPTARRAFVTVAGVYAIGHNGDCGASRVYVHRFTTAGVSDPKFGAAGEIVVGEGSLGGSGGGAQPDGRIVVTFSAANTSTGIARLMPTAPFVPAPAYTPVGTTRVLMPTQVGAQRSVTITVQGTNVAAVSLDVAVARSRASGSVLAYPTGGKVPPVTTHAHVAGQAVTQRITVPLGSGGRITLRNVSSGSSSLAANLVGFYRTSAYVAVPPARVLQARGLGAGKIVSFAVAGRSGVPATGAKEVLVNVWVNGVTRAGSLKLYAAGAAVPAAVLASHAAGRPGNASIRVTLGTGGRLTVLNNATSSGNVTVDVVGYLKS